MRGNIPTDDASRPDDRSFSDPYVGQNYAMRPDEDILFDEDSSVAVWAPGTPVEVGKDGCAIANGAVIADVYIGRMEFVDVHQLGDPNLLADIRPAQAMEQGSQATASGSQEGQFV